MKQKIFISSLITIFLIGFGGTNVFADIENPLGETSDIYTLVMKILDFLIVLAIPLTAILVIYAGFVYITSAGNEEKLKTAQKTLIWALIGFAVVLLAKGIPQLIIDFLQGNNSTSQSLNEPLNESSYDNSLNIDLSQVPLGGYVFDPNAPLEDSCHWDNNAFESDPRCGGGGGGGGYDVFI